MGASRRSYPRFRREGVPKAVDLTDDDVAIISAVYRHRFVRADDLYRLFPGRTPDRLSRRLTALYRSGYLDRPIAQIDRFRQGGSQALVYGLDKAGARLLKERFGAPIGTVDWRARNRSFGRQNLDHTVEVARFLIDIELACAARDDLAFIPFEEILAKAPAETQRAQFPGRWPVDIHFYGARRMVYLAPDAIFGIRQRRADGFSRAAYFFLELDRGTMTIAPSERIRETDAFIHRSSILRKFTAYAESWRQELHRAKFGFSAPRVLMLTTSTARASAMRQAASEMIRTAQALPMGAMLFGIARTVDSSPIGVIDIAGTKISVLPTKEGKDSLIHSSHLTTDLRK